MAKQAYALRAGPHINPELHVTTVTLFGLSNKQS
jgi:hypothetical protein